MTDETVFAEALGQRSPEERAEFLNAACPDPAQRARVESLLAAHDRAGGFLDRPAVAGEENSDVTRTTPSDANVTRTTDPNAAEPADEVNPTAFLAPPGRPDSLGRLGHYEVLEVLGQGGFGIVYRAFDDKLQRVVAVKVMAPHLAVTSPARKRFLREARSSAAVRHENVVQVHAVEEAPLPYLVMEYIPGETLQQRLDRTGPLDLTEVLRVGRQIADGLAAAHATGLIHRDIKPSNILIDSGPNPSAKITDFGLARAADDASLTRSGTVAGTPMYMAPEQAKGETLDHRADLFSLGSVLYQMASGRPPFRANSTLAVLKRVAEDDPRPIREVIPEVPDWYCRIVEKLHAKNPADRFQTAREVADLLADCEKQLADGNRLTDTSRIPLPAARPVRATRVRAKGVPVWVWLLVAGLGLAVVGCLTVPVLAMMSWLTFGSDTPQQPQAGKVESTGPPTAMVKDVAFAPLFNGKDLTGWKEFPDGRGSWKVEDGVLVGKGQPSHLFTERGDFTNFHLRMELRMRGGTKAGAVGLFTRVPVEDPGMVISPHGESSMSRFPVPKLYADTLVGVPDMPTYREKPIFLWGGDLKGESTKRYQFTADEWLTIDLILDGRNLELRVPDRVHGAKSLDYTAANAVPGHIALQLFDDFSAVEIRKIEIKELSPQPDADRIQGEWVVVAGGTDGTTAPAASGEVVFMRFGENDYTITSPGLQLAGTYRIDPSRREVFLQVGKDPVLLPVGYRFDADRLRLTFPVGVLSELSPTDRIRNVNNLKHLAVAVHNYSEAHNRTLPPPALTAPKGNTPLLSWRVALLPFIEQDELYKQFKLDEPWDSEHNKKLIEKMPKMFATPGASAPAGQTHYRAFTGPGTVFEVDKDGRSVVAFTNILDGTSNTLLFAEAAEPTIWTKPDDLPFDPKKLPKLGVSPDGVNVAFADGSVHTLALPLKDDTLRGLITRNGGELVTVPVVKPAKGTGGMVLECVRSEFRSLFNGKDAVMWMNPDRGATAWKQEGTELVGRNRKEAWFWNLTGTNTHFHLRAEVKLTGSGEAGVYFAEGNTVPPTGMGVDLTARKGVRFGSLVKGGKVVAEAGERAIPTDWVRLEVIANGRQWRVLIDGKQAAEYREPDDKRGKTAVVLQQSRNPQPGDDSVIRFRKIEIRELPRPSVKVEVPRTAADFLPFVRGTWSHDGEIVEPKAEAKRVGGQVAFDPVAGGTVLRGLNVDEHATPTSLVLHSYNPASGWLSSWYFGPDGTTDSDAGNYDPSTRLFTWMEKLPDGGHSTHNLTVVDANTVLARHYDTDAKGKFVYESRGTFTRSNLPPVVPKEGIDPKRPAEMKVLDKLVGEWKTEITVKPAVETWRTTARLTLGGRFVEMTGTKDGGGASDYAVVWYDPAAKAYRQWYFNSDGHVMTLTGTWDAVANQLTWETADKTKSGHWTFKGDGWEFRRAITDGKGKVVSEATGVSVRAKSEPAPPKAVPPK